MLSHLCPLASYYSLLLKYLWFLSKSLNPNHAIASHSNIPFPCFPWSPPLTPFHYSFLLRIIRIFQTINFFYSLNQCMETKNKITFKAMTRWGSVFILTIGFCDLIHLGKMVAIQIKQTSLWQRFWPMPQYTDEYAELLRGGCTKQKSPNSFDQRTLFGDTVWGIFGAVKRLKILDLDKCWILISVIIGCAKHCFTSDVCYLPIL